jgi:hypothetical protein
MDHKTVGSKRLIILNNSRLYIRKTEIWHWCAVKVSVESWEKLWPLPSEIDGERMLREAGCTKWGQRTQYLIIV